MNVNGDGAPSPESDAVTPEATAPLAPGKPTGTTGRSKRGAFVGRRGGDGGRCDHEVAVLEEGGQYLGFRLVRYMRDHQRRDLSEQDELHGDGG